MNNAGFATNATPVDSYIYKTELYKAQVNELIEEKRARETWRNPMTIDEFMRLAQKRGLQMPYRVKNERATVICRQGVKNTSRNAINATEGAQLLYEKKITYPGENGMTVTMKFLPAECSVVPLPTPEQYLKLQSSTLTTTFTGVSQMAIPETEADFDALIEQINRERNGDYSNPTGYKTFDYIVHKKYEFVDDQENVVAPGTPCQNGIRYAQMPALRAYKSMEERIANEVIYSIDSAAHYTWLERKGEEYLRPYKWPDNCEVRVYESTRGEPDGSLNLKHQDASRRVPKRNDDNTSHPLLQRGEVDDIVEVSAAVTYPEAVPEMCKFKKRHEKMLITCPMLTEEMLNMKPSITKTRFSAYNTTSVTYAPRRDYLYVGPVVGVTLRERTTCYRRDGQLLSPVSVTDVITPIQLPESTIASGGLEDPVLHADCFSWDTRIDEMLTDMTNGSVFYHISTSRLGDIDLAKPITTIKENRSATIETEEVYKFINPEIKDNTSPMAADLWFECGYVQKRDRYAMTRHTQAMPITLPANSNPETWLNVACGHPRRGLAHDAVVEVGAVQDEISTLQPMQTYTKYKHVGHVYVIHNPITSFTVDAATLSFRADSPPSTEHQIHIMNGFKRLPSRCLYLSHDIKGEDDMNARCGINSSRIPEKTLTIKTVDEPKFPSMPVTLTAEVKLANVRIDKPNQHNNRQRL